jgi:DNA-binding transcriptional ArsR family regulator
MKCKESPLLKDLKPQAKLAAAFLKGLASPQRLLILCLLAEGEKDVASLIGATGIAQTSMSQHLAKLKKEGVVTFRRQHRQLYYSIASLHVLEIMGILYQAYCKESRK